MIVKRSTDIAASAVDIEGAEAVRIRWLIGPDTQAPHFYLRQFEVDPGGHTPYHSHPFEHEVFILEGKGRINTAGGEIPLEKDMFAFVAGNEAHQFENTGKSVLKFLCIVPRE